MEVREVSLNPPSFGYGAIIEDGVKHFQGLLDAPFLAMRSLVKAE